MNTLATWTPIYWQPVMGSGERIMAGALVDFDNKITAHRLIRNDVLKTLYGSSAKNLEKLLDTAFNLQQQMAQTIGLDKLPELMGLQQGATHTTTANSRIEAVRQAILLYSSMCNMDVHR